MVRSLSTDIVRNVLSCCYRDLLFRLGLSRSFYLLRLWIQYVRQLSYRDMLPVAAVTSEPAGIFEYRGVRARSFTTNSIRQKNFD